MLPESGHDDVIELAYLGANAGYDDPRSYQDAISRHDAQQWRDAMQREIDQLQEMGTWELVDLPEGRSVIGCKWVFQIKRDFKGRIVKYKARLVAQGFT